MSEDPTSVNRDFADALKMEVSGLTPQKEAQLKEYTVIVKGSIEKQLGKYFGPDTLNKVKGLEDRVISFESKDNFSEYLRLFWGTDREQKIEGIHGIHTPVEMGDLAVIQPMEEYSTEHKEEVERLAGIWKVSKDEAKKNFERIEFRNTLVHEILHAYEDDHLPLFFVECAVPYYITDVMHDTNDGTIRYYKWDERIAFYMELIRTYGDNIHRLFFGSNQDIRLKAKVFAAFIPSILKEIFPKGLPSEEKRA